MPSSVRAARRPPLALELAAARVRTPHARSSSSSGSPSGSTCSRAAATPTAPADAARDDRVELRPADEDEQQLFARLAVFRGGCTLGRRRRSPTPTSTRCSRWSTRACSATRTSASGCSRRSASSHRAARRSGEEAELRRRHALSSSTSPRRTIRELDEGGRPAGPCAHRRRARQPAGRARVGTRFARRRGSAPSGRCAHGTSGRAWPLPREATRGSARARARIVARPGANGGAARWRPCALAATRDYDRSDALWPNGAASPRGRATRNSCRAR